MITTAQRFLSVFIHVQQHMAGRFHHCTGVPVATSTTKKTPNL